MVAAAAAARRPRRASQRTAPRRGRCQLRRQQAGPACTATAATAAPAPAPGAQHPRGGEPAKKQRGQGEDQDQAGHDERGTARPARRGGRGPARRRRSPAGSRPGRAAGCRRRWRLRTRGRQPALALDAQLAQQLDVGRRPAEADAADAAPFPHHHGQARPPRDTRVRVGVTHRTAAEVSSSIGLPDGWSNTIWRVCTPAGQYIKPV